MIVTDIEIKDFFYKFLKDSALVSEVSGGLFKDARPLNSTEEDVIIAVLARDGRQVQSFTVNVNVYVPDLKRNGEYVEDSARLRQLASMSNSLFDEKVSGRFILEMDFQQILSSSGINYHVINNRVSVRALNVTDNEQ